MNYKVSIIAASMVLGLFCFAAEGMKGEEKLLFQGAQTGSVILLETALAMGARIEAKNAYAWRALHWVAFNGYLECLRVLLQKGAQIEAKNAYGWTALSMAAQKGLLGCLKALLENGAQIEVKNDSVMSAVHYAAMTGQLECLRALLLAGAHIIVDEAHFKIRPLSEDKVRISRRRLKVALLAFRYAGSGSEGAKSENSAGDLITSNSYLRSWIFLSHPGTREDVFTVLMSLLANGKKVDYPLFEMAQAELGDYLVIRLRDTLNKINTPKSIESVLGSLSEEKQDEIRILCASDLVEKNFGDLIRSSIRKRFRELYLTNCSQGTVASSQSSSSVKYQSTTMSR